MKTSYAALSLALSATAAFGQKAGDTVTPDALGKSEWFKGEAPATWEPGKVYMIECWATWCGPCIAAIPHVDALYDKYSEKGFRVIGMNVWEERPGDEKKPGEKIKDFLKEKGDGMSYPVAMAAKDGDFDKEWLKPGEVRGIPHAFIVKNGKVVLTTHPAQLTEATIEGLLEGGDAETKILAEIEAKKAKQERTTKSMKDFQAASAAKDVAGMEKAMAEIGTLDPNSPYGASMLVDLAVAKKDWSGAEAQIGKLRGKPAALMVTMQAARAALKDETPAGFRKAVAEEMAEALGSQPQPVLNTTLAKLQWSLGEKEAAVATAKKGLEQAQELAVKNPKFPLLPFERFAAALEKGEVPSDEDFNGWVKEAQAAATAPVKPAAEAAPKE
ncbi:redoxin family protein [Luteolibacter sp. Populi]|uniref:redoxin family protein n=1 Tax=Luteolibacter sp. Populi TaxID=3230487 RepID=UPI003466E457